MYFLHYESRLPISRFFFSLPPLPLLLKVAGIVGRADLLCALFFQLSFLTYCKAFYRGRFRARGLLLMSAATLHLH